MIVQPQFSKVPEAPHRLQTRLQTRAGSLVCQETTGNIHKQQGDSRPSGFMLTSNGCHWVCSIFLYQLAECAQTLPAHPRGQVAPLHPCHTQKEHTQVATRRLGGRKCCPAAVHQLQKHFWQFTISLAQPPQTTVTHFVTWPQEKAK